MTDRHAAYIVTLREDIREDDAADILTALRQITGVLSVEPVVSDIAVHVGEQRARIDAGNRLVELAVSIMKGSNTDGAQS